jgi:hypothetical protein
VTRVRKRGMLAKQNPSNSQPIVFNNVPFPIGSNEVEKEAPIQPMVSLPNKTIKPNGGLIDPIMETSKDQPIVQPTMDNSFEIGMPKVPSSLDTKHRRSKNFNPIVNGGDFGCNPIDDVIKIPSIANLISLINPPIGIVLLEPSNST